MSDAIATTSNSEVDGPELAAFCRLPASTDGADDRLATHLADRPHLERVGAPPVIAIVAEPPGRDPDQLDAAVMRRHRLLADLAADLPTLPVRWGCRVPSVDWLVDHIDRTRRALDAAFDRVGGCLELVVRVPRTVETDDSDGEGGNGGPGRAFLERRRASMARRPDPEDPQWSRWRSALQPVVRDWQPLAQPADTCRWYGSRHLEITILYETSRHEAVLETIRETAPTGAEPAAAVTDPFPPYSFVDIDWPDASSAATDEEPGRL